jgi:RNA polymerase sigma factor (TIGR02999 family)
VEAGPHEVSELLGDWSKGDPSAREKLIPLVYDQLRHLAHRHMARERFDHSLQATALVNEAYVRIVDQNCKGSQTRAQFFALASQVMRNILVDYARQHSRLKRGKGWHRITLDEGMFVSSQRSGELVALDDALNELAAVDPRRSRVVELRYFGGLSVEETAEVLQVSTVTVMRDWTTAKAWLYRAINKAGE